ncbi:putative ATP-utilizing enzyme {ATP-grasp superfamily} [Geoglobus ahangari]|uniref:Putative ATP-utilizing enzyme (ATP-grasp superfamily) n=1 Tax=Geoglobus ahangari TaxID=113653 RepID=A0A0F7IFV8_9EURY|nr:ATP-grasp domain-containing protein [Geoglobus ahangari]AKG91418.1 putative ATP-utilizing enzyme {ATP-grasp superfamily} [Geoglobus ahangari]
MRKRSRLFIYEHGVCEEKIPDSIAVEGLAMFKSMLSFSRYYDLVSYIRPEFSGMFPFPTEFSFRECLESADAALIVAPENDLTLLKLVREVERAGVENLGSSSRAVEITSDKWKTYRKLKGKVSVPETSLKDLSCDYLVKPRVSCGGEGIRRGGEVPKGFIAQELIEGKSVSVSLHLGEDIEVLSVNEQILSGFEYRGAVVPGEWRDDVIEEAVNAASEIKGLNGYVGVDLVVADVPYVIEVNARLTTPSVAFELAYGMSYADMHHRISAGEGLRITPLRRVMLTKGRGEGYVSFNGHSIILKTI